MGSPVIMLSSTLLVPDGRIGRHTFARLQQKFLPDFQLGHRHHNPILTAPHLGIVRLQTDQLANGGTRLPFCTQLKPTAQQDQGHDHCCCLEIDHPCPLWQNRRCKKRDCRECPGRAGTHGDQTVHRRRTPPKCGKSGQEKLPSRTDQNRCGQDELNDPTGFMANRGADKVMPRRENMAAHLKHEHRKCQRGGRQHGIALLKGLRGLARALVLDFCLLLDMGRIPRLCRCIDQGGRAGQPRHITQQGGFIGKVDLHLNNARHRPQGAVDPADAGCTRHPSDGQAHLLGPRGVTCGLQHGNDLGKGCSIIDGDLRCLFGKIDADFFCVMNLVQRLGDPAGATTTGHVLHRKSNGLLHQSCPC
jgi:hypothetical protein